MINLEAIQAQIDQLQRGRQFTSMEDLPRLTEILWPTEKIEKITEASDGDGFLRGILVLTDQRLIGIQKICLISGGKFFIKKKCMIEVNEFLYEDIFDVYREGFGKVTIEIIKPNRRFSFILMDKSQDIDFCDYIESKLLGKTK